jgi:hypothetical protein
MTVVGLNFCNYHNLLCHLERSDEPCLLLSIAEGIVWGLGSDCFVYKVAVMIPPESHNCLTLYSIWKYLLSL